MIAVVTYEDEAKSDGKPESRGDEGNAPPTGGGALDIRELPAEALTLDDRAALARGDRALFERLFRAHWPVLYRISDRILLDHDAAEEAAQEAFVRAYRARATFRGGTHAELVGWLAAIARRNALDELRHRRRRAPEEDAASAHATTPDPALEAERSETCAEVRRALAALDPADRAVIVLAEIEDRPHSEIAALMSLTVGAIKVRLHRARRRFREAYGKITGLRLEVTRRDGEDHV